VENDTKLKIERIKAKDNEIVEKIKAHGQHNEMDLLAKRDIQHKKGREESKMVAKQLTSENKAKIMMLQAQAAS